MAGRAAAYFEREGIPSMVMTREGFPQVVGNAFAGLGFSAEGPSVYEFAHAVFEPLSDLTPVNENIDKIVYGLTKWEPKIREKGVVTPPKITATGKDYEEAVANMNNLFLRNMCTDGLAIWPATEERVSWILTGTDLPRDEVVGKIEARGGIGTIETLAVALAMAGGRPEYFPALIAIVEAMVHPDFQLKNMNATGNTVYPVAAVNGPITKQIRLGSGTACLGPDPSRAAGGSIGRAVRLVLMNVGGAVPGSGTMSQWGGAPRYASVIFAEDEDGLPEGWEPLSVERGFAPGSNVVTTYPVNAQILCGGFDKYKLIAEKATERELLEAEVRNFAEFLRLPAWSYFMTNYHPKGSPGIFLTNRLVARRMAAEGWTKADLRKMLWEGSKLPDTPGLRFFLEKGGTFSTIEPEWVQYPTPICVSPDNIMIAVCGGPNFTQGYWMPVGVSPYAPTSAEIKLPTNWDELLKQAEEDLGPIPSWV